MLIITVQQAFYIIKKLLVNQLIATYLLKNASEALAIFSSVDLIFFLIIMNSLRILCTIMFGINKADSLLKVFETMN